MARIDIKSAGATLNDGVLQLQGGVAMSSTLTAVADQNDTTSPLKLSTTAVQVVSPLRITTDDPSDMYLDCEDGSTNNRFNITRNTASQQVNLNFASNPAGSTTIVGAIRTYVDGVNLSEVMSFREDGNVGIGTTTPTTKLHVSSSSSTTATIEASGRPTISFVNSGTTMGIIGGAVAVTGGAINDFGIGTNGTSNNLVFGTGTLYTERMRIQPGGNVGIGETSPTAKLSIKGSGSTSATTSLVVENSVGSRSLTIFDDKSSEFGGSVTSISGGFITTGGSPTNDSFYTLLSGQLRYYVSLGGYLKSTSQLISNTNGTGTINASAILQADSTTQGFLPPRMTDAQIRAIATPAEGLIAYNTDISHLCCYQAGAWVKFSHSPM